MRRVILASLVLSYLTACTIYLGDDDDEPCEIADPVQIVLVDPQTLACIDYTSDCGCYPCDSIGLGREDAAMRPYGGAGGGTADSAEDGLIAVPTWGSCDSACIGQDEAGCLATAGCRVAHDWGCYTREGPCTAEVSYLGCYPIDTTGPIIGGCEGLDAYWCSMHEDCIALHDTYSGTNAFVECVSLYDF